MQKDERILNLTREELSTKGQIPIEVFSELEDIFKKFACVAFDTIKENNENGKNTVIIMPLGPTGHYKYLAKMVNENGLSLKNTTFINMDEYMWDEKTFVDISDPLSFEGTMYKLFYDKIDESLIMPKEQRIFPNLNNGELIRTVIKNHGKVDLCLGGIGIDGHVAFNEPPTTAMTDEEYLKLSVRVLPIAMETVITNAISSNGGAIEFIPRYACTIGFNEIMQSKKILLCCNRPWHRMTVRKASFYKKSAEFPVTLLQGKDVVIHIPETIAD